jgi:periplasmic copper chaperone A
LRPPAALLAACLALPGHAALSATAPALSAADAWVRAIPGSDVAAAYLTLHNAGTQPVVVVGVRSALAAHAMIHETTEVNGQSSMRPHETLRVAGGATVRLAPGGLHIMLHGLSAPLTPGQTVPLVLLLGGGGTLAVSARVRPLGAE